ncbi:MAG: FHA domain-containing protein [Phycisphaerales bacterium]
MDVVLIRVQEDGSTAEVPLKKSKTVFGRGEECTVRVPAASVSRRHCEIEVADGSIVVRDLGSSNGTFVNQERVESKPVAGGDLVSFGGFVFVVQVNGDPDDIDAELMYEDGLPEEASGAGGKATASHPTQTGTGPARESLVPAGDLDESSVVEFDFDLDDDEDDQPPL